MTTNVHELIINESTPKSVYKDYTYQNVKLHTTLSRVWAAQDVTLREIK